MKKSALLADGLELIDLSYHLEEVTPTSLDGSKVAFSPRRDGLEGLTEKVDEAR